MPREKSEAKKPAAANASFVRFSELTKRTEMRPKVHAFLDRVAPAAFVPSVVGTMSLAAMAVDDAKMSARAAKTAQDNATEIRCGDSEPSLAPYTTFQTLSGNAVVDILASHAASSPALCNDLVEKLRASLDATTLSLRTESPKLVGRLFDAVLNLVISPAVKENKDFHHAAIVELLICVAFCSGQLSYELRVVETLIGLGDSQAELPDSVRDLYLKSLKGALQVPTQTTARGSFTLSAPYSGGADEYAVGTDGEFLYVLTNDGLSKIGTGDCGTEAGRVYASTTEVRHGGRGTQMAVAAGSVYITQAARGKSEATDAAIGPFPLHVIGARDLKSTGVIERAGQYTRPSGGTSSFADLYNPAEGHIWRWLGDGRYLYAVQIKGTGDREETRLLTFDSSNKLVLISTREITGPARDLIPGVSEGGSVAPGGGMVCVMGRPSAVMSGMDDVRIFPPVISQFCTDHRIVQATGWPGCEILRDADGRIWVYGGTQGGYQYAGLPQGDSGGIPILNDFFDPPQRRVRLLWAYNIAAFYICENMTMYITGDAQSYGQGFRTSEYRNVEPAVFWTFDEMDPPVAMGGTINNVFVLLRSGTLLCGGQNGNGVNGQGHQNATVGFVKVNIPPVKMVRGADYHMMALDENGDVWTWGYNDGGQANLADLASNVSSTPTKVNFAPQFQGNFVDIHAMGRVNCVLTDTGAVYAWGNDACNDAGLCVRNNNDNNQAITGQMWKIDVPEPVYKLGGAEYATFFTASGIWVPCWHVDRQQEGRKLVLLDMPSARRVKSASQMQQKVYLFCENCHEPFERSTLADGSVSLFTNGRRLASASLSNKNGATPELAVRVFDDMSRFALDATAPCDRFLPSFALALNTNVTWACVLSGGRLTLQSYDNDGDVVRLGLSGHRSSTQPAVVVAALLLRILAGRAQSSISNGVHYFNLPHAISNDDDAMRSMCVLASTAVEKALDARGQVIDHVYAAILAQTLPLLGANLHQMGQRAKSGMNAAARESDGAVRDLLLRLVVLEEGSDVSKNIRQLALATLKRGFNVIYRDAAQRTTMVKEMLSTWNPATGNSMLGIFLDTLLDLPSVSTLVVPSQDKAVETVAGWDLFNEMLSFLERHIATQHHMVALVNTLVVDIVMDLLVRVTGGELARDGADQEVGQVFGKVLQLINGFIVASHELGAPPLDHPFLEELLPHLASFIASADRSRALSVGLARQLVNPLVACFRALGHFVQATGGQGSWESNKPIDSIQIETPHPYPNAFTQDYAVSFPDADYITVRFHNKTSTAVGDDVVELYQEVVSHDQITLAGMSRDDWEPVYEKFFGEPSRWPNYPLPVRGSKVTIRFSAASQQDDGPMAHRWGMLATVSGHKFPASETNWEQTNVFVLYDMVSHAAARVARALVKSEVPAHLPATVEAATVFDTPIFVNGLKSTSEMEYVDVDSGHTVTLGKATKPTEAEVTALMQGLREAELPAPYQPLVNWLEDAQRKREEQRRMLSNEDEPILEDHLYVPVLNRIQRSAFAALLNVHGLADQALALATAVARGDASVERGKNVIRLWSAANRVRVQSMQKAMIQARKQEEDLRRAPYDKLPVLLIEHEGEAAAYEFTNNKEASVAIAARNCVANKGQFYYEVLLRSDLVILQVGVAGQDFNGSTVGDDPCSWGYDGNDHIIWHAGEHAPYGPTDPAWKAGDVIGVGVDFDAKTIFFTINGALANGDVAFRDVSFPEMGVFPAVSMLEKVGVTMIFNAEVQKYRPGAYKAWDQALVREATAPGAVSTSLVASILSSVLTDVTDRCVVLHKLMPAVAAPTVIQIENIPAVPSNSPPPSPSGRKKAGSKWERVRANATLKFIARVQAAAPRRARDMATLSRAAVDFICGEANSFQDAKPQAILEELSSRRSAAVCRAEGYTAFAILFSEAALAHQRQDLLVDFAGSFLREEKNDRNVITINIRARHYLEGIHGVGAELTQLVAAAFRHLYGTLGEFIRDDTAPLAVQEMLIRAWNVPFVDDDHDFLLQVGLFPALRRIMANEGAPVSNAAGKQEESRAFVTTLVPLRVNRDYIVTSSNPALDNNLQDNNRNTTWESMDGQPWINVKVRKGLAVDCVLLFIDRERDEAHMVPDVIQLVRNRGGTNYMTRIEGGARPTGWMVLAPNSEDKAMPDATYQIGFLRPTKLRMVKAMRFEPAVVVPASKQVDALTLFHDLAALCLGTNKLVTQAHAPPSVKPPPSPLRDKLRRQGSDFQSVLLGMMFENEEEGDSKEPKMSSQLQQSVFDLVFDELKRELITFTKHHQRRLNEADEKAREVQSPNVEIFVAGPAVVNVRVARKELPTEFTVHPVQFVNGKARAYIYLPPGQYVWQSSNDGNTWHDAPAAPGAGYTGASIEVLTAEKERARARDAAKQARKEAKMEARRQTAMKEEEERAKTRALALSEKQARMEARTKLGNSLAKEFEVSFDLASEVLAHHADEIAPSRLTLAAAKELSTGAGFPVPLTVRTLLRTVDKDVALLRLNLAQNLCDLGFDQIVALRALERCGDNPEEAAVQLMENLAALQVDDAPASRDQMRLEAAEEMVKQSNGQLRSVQMALFALEHTGDHLDAAMSFIATIGGEKLTANEPLSRIRMGFSTSEMLGMDFAVCVKALSKSNDSMENAVGMVLEQADALQGEVLQDVMRGDEERAKQERERALDHYLSDQDDEDDEVDALDKAGPSKTAAGAAGTATVSGWPDDTEAFELINLVHTLSGTAVGVEYISRPYLLQTLLSLLITLPTQRVQRTLVAILSRVAQTISIEQMQASMDLLRIQRGWGDMGDTTPLDTLDFFLSQLNKAMSVEVKTPKGTVTPQFGGSVYTLPLVPTHTAVASDLVTLLRSLTSLGQWVPIVQSMVVPAFQTLTSLKEAEASDFLAAANSPRTEKLWHLLAVMCLVSDFECRLINTQLRAAGIEIDVREPFVRAKVYMSESVQHPSLIVIVDVTKLKVKIEYRTITVATSACRFCGAEVVVSNEDVAPSAQTLATLVCGAEVCRERGKLVCNKVHPCGHACNGVIGEATCLPCLVPGCKNHTGRMMHDGDDYCAICWTDSLKAAPCVQLGCSHVFHATCARSILERRWPGAAISYGFMGCPLCKATMEHPFLAPLLGELNGLRNEHKAKALMRLEYDGFLTHADVTSPAGPFFQNPEGYAMDRYAYYLCFKCQHPYFGGERACGEAGPLEFNPRDLICGGCQGFEGMDCPKHGKDFIEFKCRYCCSVAVWFCFGTTHFCDPCHNNAGSNQTKGDCEGGPDCPLKVAKHPPHGEEFMMGCGLCRNVRSF